MSSEPGSGRWATSTRSPSPASEADARGPVVDIVDQILGHAEAAPGQLAVVDPDSTLTYGELADGVRRTAAGLASYVQPGDRVCLHLPNSADFLVAALACLDAGIIFVPLPFYDPPARQARIVDDAEPAVIITRSPSDVPDWAAGRRTATPAVLAASALPAPRPTKRDPRRRAYCVYTSGSTGVPKGVLIRQDSLANAVGNTVADFGLSPEARAMCISPFHFDGAFGSLFSVPAAGGSLVIPKREVVMLPRWFFGALLDNGITHCTFSPSFLRVLLGAPEARLFGQSALRTLGIGGERLFAADALRLHAVAPGIRVVNRYGPTETAIAVSGCAVTERLLAEVEDIPLGRPHPGVSFHLVDNDGQLIDRPGQGELWIGGVQVMEGYWNDAALTASVLRDDLVDGETLYRTNDIVRRDDNGVYTYVDRVDNMVKRAGNRVSLSEIVSALLSIAGVQDAACLVDSQADGARLRAFIVAPGSVDNRVLRRELMSRIPTYMMPDELVVVDELPKTTVGKVDLRGLSRPPNENMA